ncbi:MAG: hypothetical protein FD149_1814 [Rhodospirillaceae bacterium]|nr:MAG: hypothetical protein FD149_1814 [Rhodospirillaceae bacterium]
MRGGAWSRDRTLDKNNGVGASFLWLRANPDLAPSLKARVEGWIGTQRLFDAGQTKGELREGHVRYTGDVVDVRIGRQIVVWGRAELSC